MKKLLKLAVIVLIVALAAILVCSCGENGGTPADTTEKPAERTTADAGDDTEPSDTTADVSDTTVDVTTEEGTTETPDTTTDPGRKETTAEPETSKAPDTTKTPDTTAAPDTTAEPEVTTTPGTEPEPETPLDPNGCVKVNYNYHVVCNNQMPFEADDSVAVDYNNFVKGDGSEFNFDIADMAITLLIDSYGADFTFGGSTVKAPLYEKFCLENAKDYTMASTDFDTNKNDLSNLTVSNHVFKADDGKSYQLFAVVIAAQYVDNTGWLSNFDVGADTDSYYLLNGSADEWTNKKDHKGFTVTTARVYEKVKEYIGDNAVDGASPVIFITGQSRGAAISNLLGKRFVDEKTRCLVYGFNTPTTTCEDNGEILSSYKTIFNIVNGNDFVSEMPCPAWGFTRYGIDMTYKISDAPAMWNEYFGKNYVALDETTLASLRSVFAGLAATRTDIYDFDRREGVLELQTSTYSNESKANEYIDDIKSLFPEGSKQLDCITFDVKKNDDGTVTVTYIIRPALITYIVPSIVDSIQADADIFSILLTVTPYLGVMEGYVDNLLPLVLSLAADTEFTNRFLYSHVMQTNLVGLEMLKAETVK